MMRSLLIVALFLLLSARAFAHVLITTETAPSSWGSAASIRDPGVSQVFYGRVGPGRARVWLRFAGKAGDRISFTVGVPFVKRLEGFRPSAAIIGSGLPPPPATIDAPPGTGAIIFGPSEEARIFHEEFTGTTSWIVVEDACTVPAAGTCYLLAFADNVDPAHDKLWLAIGSREVFGFGDILGFFAVRRFVRHFHEIDRRLQKA